MLHNIAEGMRYLSQMGFVHKNLSSESVLVNDRLVCKISNFCVNKPLESIEEESSTLRNGKVPALCIFSDAVRIESATFGSG